MAKIRVDPSRPTAADPADAPAPEEGGPATVTPYQNGAISGGHSQGLRRMTANRSCSPRNESEMTQLQSWLDENARRFADVGDEPSKKFVAMQEDREFMRNLRRFAFLTRSCQPDASRASIFIDSDHYISFRDGSAFFNAQGVHNVLQFF